MTPNQTESVAADAITLTQSAPTSALPLSKGAKTLIVEPIPPRPVHWVRRHPFLAGLAAMMLLVLVAGAASGWGLAWWALRERHRAEARANVAVEAEIRAQDKAAAAHWRVY